MLSLCYAMKAFSFSLMMLLLFHADDILLLLMLLFVACRQRAARRAFRCHIMLPPLLITLFAAALPLLFRCFA